MICPHCGVENASGQRFCRKCGRAVKNAKLDGIVTCKNHGNRPATTSCGTCGQRFCDECVVLMRGIAFCAQCVPAPGPSEEERIARLAVADPSRAARAGFGTRLTADIVDGMVLLFAGVVLAAIFWALTGVFPLAVVFYKQASPASWLYWALMAASVSAYFVVFTSAGGQTLGKQAMAIAVIREDGAAPRPRDCVCRFLGSIVSLSVFGLGFLAVLAEPQRLAWHDRWAHTLVVCLE